MEKKGEVDKTSSERQSLEDNRQDVQSETANWVESITTDESEKEEENVFGKDFEIFDKLSPTDELWNKRDFKQKIQGLGPDILQKPKLAAKVEPFKLEWVFGFNRDASIINLFNSNNQKIVFYNVPRCGVVYNITENKMQFLQGHPNKVIAISSTNDGDFLATADSGPDNIIIIWERSNLSPVMIYFDPYVGHNILGIALSPSGMYFVSIGEHGEEDMKIDLRLWNKYEDEPNGTVYMGNYYGKVLQIKFNIDREYYFTILFERGIAFVNWDMETNSLSQPIVPMIKYKGRLGYLTDMTYIEQCHEIMVSTSEGCVIFFGSSLYYHAFNEKEISPNIKTIKICKITKTAVHSIDSADGVVITGDGNGLVSLFDKRLRLIFWYNEFIDKPVFSVRFNMLPRQYHLSNTCLNHAIEETPIGGDGDEYFEDKSEKYEIIYKDQLRPDASLLKERWVIRDFIIVQSDTVSFVEFVKEVSTVLFERGHDHVGAIAVHDEFTYLTIGYKNGTICLIDYTKNGLYVTKKLPPALDEEEDPAVITCMEYSPKSLFLACGRSNGEIWMLDPVLLTPRQEVIKVSTSSIDKIAFSVDSTQLAFCNSKMTVYLMIYKETEWVFIGKIRSHYKSIIELFFFKTHPNYLVSLGTDRNLIAYNNINISLGDELQTCLKVRIDQTAVPLTCEVYPSKHSKSLYRYLITSDNQFKYKLVNEDTQMCRLVGLGPAYGCYQDTPVTKIKILPNHDEDYMVFRTKRHFGLQKLPITGNPYSFVGCLGHPEELVDFKISGDGDYVFTIGTNDATVLGWKTQTRGVDLMQNLGGRDFEPFYCVIEGGKNGFLFQEMQDLFFYMQILHEGESSTLPRRVSDTLALSELPDLMRACGYYPTDFEIETFMVDVKYRNFDHDGCIRDSISFLEFVKLYINHKPAYGYSLTALEETFETFVQAAEDPLPGMVRRDDFLAILREEGEPFTLSQIHKCMEILLGAEIASDAGYYLFDFIPEDVDYDVFVDEILGIDMERVKIDVQDEDAESEKNSSTSTIKDQERSE